MKKINFVLNIITIIISSVVLYSVIEGNQLKDELVETISERDELYLQNARKDFMIQRFSENNPNIDVLGASIEAQQIKFK
ncbi:MAG: hypothetical protein WD512_04740 [Candidatus Paceibacterota bacterium]